VSDPLPCWATRMEVDTRYDYGSDTFDDSAPLWSPNCQHDACVAEERLHEQGTCSERFDGPTAVECPQIECRFATAHSMCDLDQGHNGEHRFVREDEITLYFVDPDDAAQERAAAGGGAGS